MASGEKPPSHRGLRDLIGDGLEGVEGRNGRSLVVCGPTTVNASAVHGPVERPVNPAFAGGHDIDMDEDPYDRPSISVFYVAAIS